MAGTSIRQLRGLMRFSLLQATQNELTVETFFPRSYEKLKQRDIPEAMVLFGIAYRTKKKLCDYKIDIREEPIWSDSTRPDRNDL